jgi:antitoxin CcdA
MLDTYKNSPKRQRTTITLPADIIAGAKEYDLNISRLTEEAVAQALKKEREQEWLQKNKGGIDAYNQFVMEHGLLVQPDWMYANEEV